MQEQFNKKFYNIKALATERQGGREGEDDV